MSDSPGQTDRQTDNGSEAKRGTRADRHTDRQTDLNDCTTINENNIGVFGPVRLRKTCQFGGDLLKETADDLCL